MRMPPLLPAHPSRAGQPMLPMLWTCRGIRRSEKASWKRCPGFQQTHRWLETRSSLERPRRACFISHTSCCFLQTPGSPAMPSPSPYPEESMLRHVFMPLHLPPLFLQRLPLSPPGSSYFPFWGQLECCFLCGASCDPPGNGSLLSALFCSFCRPLWWHSTPYTGIIGGHFSLLRGLYLSG